MEVTRGALAAERVFFWVYESGSTDALARGELQGRWRFGDAGGEWAGALVWLREAGHVVRLVVRGGARVLDGCWLACASVPPWFRYMVGAPKKSSRGANLRKGGSGYEARLLAQERRLAQAGVGDVVAAGDVAAGANRGVVDEGSAGEGAVGRRLGELCSACGDSVLARLGVTVDAGGVGDDGGARPAA